MFKNLEALSLEKPTYSPNQGRVEESLVIKHFIERSSATY